MKCVVPTCNAAEEEMFRVPNAGSSIFHRWTKVVNIMGLGTERICFRHFTSDAFVENARTKLTSTAIPSLQLPADDRKIAFKRGCCIKGCLIRKSSSLEKFPPEGYAALAKWTQILGLSDDDSTKTNSLRICRKHFARKEFVTVRSRYLKPSAVPTKDIVRPVKLASIKRRITSSGQVWLRDHNYNKEDLKPRSNRSCFVYGCTIKSSRGVFLHKFPKDEDMSSAWLAAVKSAGKPTKNSVVCSQHFHDSDYRTGSNLLKENAVPSLKLPVTSLEKTEQLRNANNPYARKFQGFRKVEATPLASFESSSEDSGSSFDCTTTPLDSSPEDTDCAALNVTEVNENPDEENENLQVLSELPFYGDVCSAEQLNSCDQNAEEQQSTQDKSSIEAAMKEVRKQDCIILSDLLLTDKDVNVWTGIATLDLLASIALAVKHLEDHAYAKKQYKMHATDRVILTMAKLKQNISFVALGTLFRISASTVSEYFSHTVQMLAEVLGQMIYWPSMEEISKNIPFCFQGTFSRVRCVLDCSEIGICCPNCLNCRIACYSSYKHKRTAKFLLGVTPAGLISYCSRAYSGKASDKHIFLKENFIGKLDKFKDEIMVDKGFAVEAECLESGIRVHIPPKMVEERLSDADALLNEKIAKARIHVERAISRVKVYGVLQQHLDATMLKHIDDILMVVCGVVNLSAPILRDDKF